MILLDPGHGLYKTGEGAWSYQRDEWWGLVEDTVTPRITEYVVDVLESRKRKVDVTRPLPGSDIGRMPGASGQPKWREGALYSLRDRLDGHPLWTERGQSDRGKDINCRPMYANFVNADVAVSIHVNASNTNSSAHGVSVWHRNSCKESLSLAGGIYDGLVVNKDFDAGRGLKGDGEGWESRHAKSLAWFKRMAPNISTCLVEFLFFTNREDNAMLHERNNLIFAAKAIADGIDLYLKERGQ